MHSRTNRANFRSEAMPLGWYAIYTRHQHEKSAARLLNYRGLEVLLPLYREVHHWKDRRKSVLLPLFPGYFFLKACSENKLEIMTTPGVCSIVSQGGVPVPLSTEDVEMVKKVAEVPAQMRPHPFLNQGDRVRIVAGPFQGCEGILVRLKSEFRVVVSVDLLGCAAAVEVEASVIEPVVNSPLLSEPNSSWANA